jgi:endonuclease G
VIGAIGGNVIKKTILVIPLIFLLPNLANSQEQKQIPSSQAAQHVGEQGTVCGMVASSRYVSTSHSKPTFLNFGKPYPQEEFTVVIWSDDRSKFGHPEETYLHKNICVTGDITSYRGTPQIIARDPRQIKLQCQQCSSAYLIQSSEQQIAAHVQYKDEEWLFMGLMLDDRKFDSHTLPPKS